MVESGARAAGGRQRGRSWQAAGGRQRAAGSVLGALPPLHVRSRAYELSTGDRGESAGGHRGAAGPQAGLCTSNYQASIREARTYSTTAKRIRRVNKSDTAARQTPTL